MSHNISDFVASVAAGNSFLRPSQFSLSIPGMPAWSTGAYDGRNVEMQCNSASLPGTNIDSIDVRRYGTGFLEYFPAGASYYDLTTTFYADANAEIILFFQEWIRNIVDFSPDVKDENFRVFYRDNYVSQVVVDQYTTEGNIALSYTYIDAFPVQIQPIGVRWYSRDEITEFDVIWKYKTWKENGSSDTGINGLGLNIPSVKNGLAGVTSALTNITPKLATVIGGNSKVQSALNKVAPIQNAATKAKSILGG